MKFAELISRYSWPEVEPVYLQLYPKEKRRRKKAREAFESIRSLRPVDTDMRIHIEFQDDDEGGYHNVSGKDGKVREDGQEESYAIFVVDWDEWLGMEIEGDTMEKYSELGILCHAFWEMTWCGYSMERVKKIEKGLTGSQKPRKRILSPSIPPCWNSE